MSDSASELREWFAEGMSAPFESIRLSIFFSTLKTALMGLQTIASKELVNNALRQIGIAEVHLVLLDVVFGFLIGFTNMLWGLAYLAGFMFVWTAFHPTLTSLGFTIQDAIFAIVPVLVGIIVRGYLKHKLRGQYT